MTTSLKEQGRKNYSTDKPCTVCGRLTEGGNTLHHVKSRGSHGRDIPQNMMPLCHAHHVEIHKKPLSEYAAKNLSVLEWLIDNGWELIKRGDESLKWIHPNA